LAGKTVERKRSLAADRIVPQGELQRAEAEAEEAKAEAQAASASLAALGVTGASGGEDLSRFLLRAPLAGTVLERRAALGGAADPSAPLFRIGDLSRLWLVVQAAERDAVRLRQGSTARIALAALPGESLAGSIAYVGNEVDPHPRTVPVRIVLANLGGRLKPGMFATAFLPVTHANDQVVAVPAVALQRLEDHWVVFLPKGEGRFEVRPVARCRDLGGEVAILSGLSPGEPVVVEGAFILRAEAEKSAGGAEHHHH
jgi:cobalt-zinc-cadmium efflux system membrane fusion protein